MAARASLLVLLLGGSTVVVSASAQEASPPPVQALVEASLAKVASIRGLPSLPSPPPVVIRSKSETKRFFEQELARKHPAARLEAERKAMVAWGLIPPDFDLRGFLADLLSEQAAAYYEPVRKVMIVGDWLKPEEQQIALAHELVHALQDRQIPIEKFLAPGPGKGDQQLARQALLEGEAVAVTVELLLQARGLDLSRIPALAGVHQLAMAFSGAAGPIFGRAPKFLQNLLIFPYVQGLAFVHQFRLRHPWSAFDRFYQDPPRSTTQILHPEKVLDRREDPIVLTLPKPRPALALGWRLASEDELGEWGLSAVLGTFLDEATSQRLARGWRGDRSQILEDSQGKLALIYRVRWEAEEPAEAFAQAYAGLLEKKYPALAGKGAKGPGSLWSWQDGSETSIVEQRGVDVLVLERVPTAAEKPLRQALWSGAPEAAPAR
ncbi:MAG: hypothetical protein HY724_02020 [Candidatus Rokubacteria bacterium]|nr:hypothetical protein [Candidatus Rokubacteria bacterium]